MSRVLSLAGFQVTIIGRFWVTAEGHELPLHCRLIRQERFQIQTNGIEYFSLRTASSVFSILVTIKRSYPFHAQESLWIGDDPVFNLLIDLL